MSPSVPQPQPSRITQPLDREAAQCNAAEGERADSQSLVRWLSTPAAYPEHPARVDVRETHISHVFLAGDFVYKLKKQVRFDFLDFSTPELRRQAALEELRLNRRMTRDVYLNVLSVTRKAGGGWEIDGPGKVVDWLVHMRRLPADRMLDTLIGEGRLTPSDVQRLADYLARFYTAAVPLAIEPREFRAATDARVRGGLPDAHTPGLAVDEIQLRRILAAQIRLLACRPELFDARVQGGRVIDGHGDLRPEHICLVDPPAVFDCLEFSAELRRNDVADELAFLAMECDRLGASQVGQAVFDAYQQHSGDQVPAELLAFYKAHRACVRAKVAALRSQQLEQGAHDAALAESAADVALADSYLRAAGARPLLVVMSGLPGSGKTTLARALADRLALELLRTDELRQQLADLGRETAERYRPAARAQVYAELLRQAGQRLARRESLILDGTFAEAVPREAAANLARDAAVDMLLVHCICPRDVALARIATRLRQPMPDASQAQPEVYDKLLAEWEWSPALAGVCRVDTTLSLESQVEICLAAVPR